jgi:hypothetical protein
VSDLCYVYCAIEGRPAALPAAGMPHAGPPRALPLDEKVTLIVSDVPAATYTPEVLEPRLSDLDWVSTAGAAHHGVVEALADSGLVVVPFRLFTIFSTADKAIALLQGNRSGMTRAFDRVRGKQEWVLRIGKPDPTRSARPGQARSTPSAGSAQVASTGSPRSEAPSSSGTSFLQAKAEAKRETAARAQRVKEDAEAAYDALEQLADAAKTRPVDTAGTLMLDAAFLVAPAQVDVMRETLTRTAERLLRDGCAVSLTGPWPPYSFASMDDTADA